MLRFLVTLLQNKKEFVQSSYKKKNKNPVLPKVKKFFVCFALDTSNMNRVMNLFGEWKSVF